MLSKIKGLFQDERQFQLFSLLSISTLFCFLLIGIRLYVLDVRLNDLQNMEDYGRLRGTATFFFLIWNLFLAWIPYCIAVCIAPISRHQPAWVIVLAFSALVVFLSKCSLHSY